MFHLFINSLTKIYSQFQKNTNIKKTTLFTECLCSHFSSYSYLSHFVCVCCARSWINNSRNVVCTFSIRLFGHIKVDMKEIKAELFHGRIMNRWNYDELFFIFFLFYKKKINILQKLISLKSE